MTLKNFGYAAFVAATAVAFVIGSGGPSQAKHKKKMEAAPVGSICWMNSGPVCATKGGMSFTYANSCYAANDGAKMVSNKACPAMKAKMHAKKKMAMPMKKKEMKKKEMKKPMKKEMKKKM